MMPSNAGPRSESLMQYWPFGVAGLLSPIAAALLSRSMPLYVAAGASFFVAWAAAIWLFERGPARPVTLRRRVGASLAGGLIGGLLVGALTLLFPWG